MDGYIESVIQCCMDLCMDDLRVNPGFETLYKAYEMQDNLSLLICNLERMNSDFKERIEKYSLLANEQEQYEFEEDGKLHDF